MRAINCYRIVQEAITNALRHAAASRIEVTLASDDGGFVLRLSDHGKCLEIGSGECSTGSGLGPMAGHAALAGEKRRGPSRPTDSAAAVIQMPT